MIVKMIRDPNLESNATKNIPNYGKGINDWSSRITILKTGNS
jgi:hypothetical protein